MNHVATLCIGLGGSVMQWHPEEQIGFGYAMTQLEVTPTNERARVLQAAVVTCAQAAAAREASGAPPPSSPSSPVVGKHTGKAKGKNVVSKI
jgi:hypothetical protein